jgi:hypothetical protein
MSRDVGTFSESKNIQTSMEYREKGYEGDGPGPSSMSWQKTFKGGKTQPTYSSFQKPSVGKVRKHME